MAANVRYVGLDVHKESIVIATAEAAPRRIRSCDNRLANISLIHCRPNTPFFATRPSTK